LFKERKRALRFRVYIFLLFSLPILALGIFSYFRVYSDLTNFKVTRRKDLAVLSATVINEKLDSLVDLGISLATRPKFIENGLQGKWKEAIGILQNTLENFTFMERIFITDTKGTITADMPVIPGIVGTSRADKDWYIGVSKDWQPYVSEVYQRVAEPKYNFVAVAVPVKPTSPRDPNQKALGILVLQIKLEVFADWVARINVGPGGFIYIVDKKGHIVYHPKYPSREKITDFSTVPIVQEVIHGKSGIELNFNPVEKEWRLAAYQPVAGYGWGVVVTQPKSLVYADRDKALRDILIIYGIILILSFLAAQLFMNMIVARQKADEELSAAMRMKEEFISTVSHELKTPLGPIREGMSIVLEGLVGEINNEQRNLLEAAKKSADRLHRLANEVLDFQKLESDLTEFRIVENDISEVINEVYELMEIIVRKKGLDFIIELDKNLPKIKFDRDRIMEVLTNLVDNAVKFTEKGFVKIKTVREKDAIHVMITDTGFGIKQEDIPRLFRSFARIERAAGEEIGGVGLGLAISKDIIQRHRGRIWVESEFGKGTTIHFVLPVKEE
jgi:signal transduction histidine kinase